MAEVIKFQEDKPSGASLLLREQLAAQVVAVMQAHFTRPSVEEMKEILRCAEGQVNALRIGFQLP